MSRIGFPLRKKKKIIICIHGLGNKPPRWLLAFWWKKAIREGLRGIGNHKFFFKLKLAYWADILHPRSLSPFIHDKNKPRHINEPYQKSGQNGHKKKASALKKKILNAFEFLADALLSKNKNVPKLRDLSDSLIKKRFQELDSYYSSKFGAIDPHISKAIWRRLEEKLRGCQGRQIMLIAHSMGTIIAYDVLNNNPDLEVDTFITLGSPLGLPYVLDRIVKDQGAECKKDMRPEAPEALRGAWHNFSDIDDTVAIIYRLANNFRANSQGIVPVDIQVNNDYSWENKANPHKIYGYLQTPEVATVIGKFLDS